MFKVAVVDTSARSRLAIAETILAKIAEAEPSSDALFGVSVKSLSIDEARFQPPPDIMVVGEDLHTNGRSELAELRRGLGGTIFIAYVSDQSSALDRLERMAAIGFDDVIHGALSAAEVAARLVLNGRRSRRPRKGRIVAIDSGKGGVGVTSVCAALGDYLASFGKRVTVVDLDFESQDLSRYLQSRPYLNENLQCLLEQGRPLTREAVEECVVAVPGQEALLCVPPPVRGELHDRHGGTPLKMFGAFLEALSQASDYVLIDCASARGELGRAAFHSCDFAIMVTSGEACAAHSTLQAISRVRIWLRPESRLLVLENGRRPCDIGAALVAREVAKQAGLDAESILSPIRYAARAASWPGSGATLYIAGGRSVRTALRKTASALGVDSQQGDGPVSLLAKAVRRKSDTIQLSNPPAALALPVPRALITAPEIS